MIEVFDYIVGIYDDIVLIVFGLFLGKMIKCVVVCKKY